MDIVPSWRELWSGEEEQKWKYGKVFFLNSQIVFIMDIEIMRSGYEYQRQRFPALISWDQSLIPIFCRPNLKNFTSGLNFSCGSNMVDSTWIQCFKIYGTLFRKIPERFLRKLSETIFWKFPVYRRKKRSGIPESFPYWKWKKCLDHFRM